MKEYYDILINGIPTGIRVRRIMRGKAWTGAELDNGGFGIAMRTAGQSIKRLFPSLEGMEAAEAAQAVMSWNMEEASEGMAVINAYYNSQSRMVSLGCRDDYNRRVTSGMETKGKKIALIGHLKLHPDALMGAKEVYIMDREPHEGDYPDSACEYILPGCDMVIITGSAAVNKTMPRLLELSKSAQTIVVGPTVPLCPELKSCGIARLSGLVVTDVEGITGWMTEVKGSPYPFGETFTI